MFKLWSENNNEVKVQLNPDLWIRNWGSLWKDEKEKIWKYLEKYFFNNDIFIYRINTRYSEIFTNVFSNFIMYEHILKEIIQDTIYNLNEMYKVKSYAKNYLKEKSLENACIDFFSIFNDQDENVVLELLSIYSKILIKYSFKTNSYIHKNDDELEDDYKIRFINYQYKYFDIFSERLNEVFNDFWLNIILTRQWFIPKQWEKIIENIYKPTLDFLSDESFKEVNRDLWDAFSDYNKKDYSGAITKTISAIQAFLQISIKWEVWKWDISELIGDAIKKWLIPNDIFTTTIFKNINSIIMRERQETADAHPKKEYANERNARLILNLSMIFIQHFIQEIN